MNNKDQIKKLQAAILINEDIINDLKHCDRLNSIFKLMILITILGIQISIFNLTKPLCLVLPPLLSILIILELTAKVIFTGGTGSRKQKWQKIAYCQEKNREYEEKIKILQQRITLENSSQMNISNNKLIPNHNFQRKLVRHK